MRVLYSDEHPFDGSDVGIFLAGPTPRSADVPSWRPKAIELLRELGFKGTVLVPEHQNESVKADYTDQVGWERAGLSLAKAIVFWIPRHIQTMPAFTTNVEFGYWLAKSPERIVYGRPDEAPKNRYLDWLISVEIDDVPIYNTMLSTMMAAIDMANK